MRLGTLHALLLTALATPHLAAAEPIEIASCGVELAAPGDYVLSQDIGPCAAGGMAITASDVHLNLAGHTVLGEQEATQCNARRLTVGISVGAAAQNAIVRGGSVSRFRVGVSTAGAGTQLSALGVLDNCVTNVELRGPGASLARSDIGGSGDGVLVTGDDVRVSGNHIHDNGRYGINHVWASRTVIERNIIDRDGLAFILGAGIALLGGSGHTIRENAILNNLDGLQVELSADSIVEGNDVHGNLAAGIVVPVPVTGFVIRGNSARGNRIDASEDNDCPANSWLDNDFGTTAGCID